MWHGLTLESRPETAQQCSTRKLPQILIRPEVAATGAIRGRSVVLEDLMFIGLGIGGLLADPVKPRRPPVGVPWFPQKSESGSESDFSPVTTFYCCPFLLLSLFLLTVRLIF